MLLATAGLGVLTLDGLSLGYGEAITLVAALLYGLHIVALGAWSSAQDALGMSIVQVIVIATICLVATAPDGLVLPATTGDWLAVSTWPSWPAPSRWSPRRGRRPTWPPPAPPS